MKQGVLAASVFAASLLGNGCAGLEQALSPIGPSGGSTSPASLLGTWTSSSSVGAGLNSCTNFQWRVTGQQGSAVSGEFSAVCGSISVAGTVSGQVNGSNVPYQIAGSAPVAGGATCSLSVSGMAHIEGDAIRVPYAGTNCFGPAQGEEVLRRPTPASPAPPALPASPAPPALPAPDAPPAPDVPSSSSYHVAAGPLTSSRAKRVVNATRDEFVGLTAPHSTEAEAISAAAELLRRMIWHLQLAGFQAGRQRNPSGALSNDKLTIFCDGAWHAFDVFRSLGRPGQAAEVIFLEVFPPTVVADGGIPD